MRLRTYLAGYLFLQVTTGYLASAQTNVVVNPILDCSKPGSAAGQLICSDAALTRSYLELGLAYKTQYNSQEGEEQKKIQDEQVRWVRSRNKACELEGKASTLPADTSAAKKCLSD